MNKHAWLSQLTLAAFMVTMVVAPATSAPMFPDLPQEHWARDAVAALAAKGLVEGYPDGTFKGDRAATRYEVAMIVARLLAKVEQEEATFATKADLDALRRLVDQLHGELDALGVRVQNLENNVGKLDKRVTELERIRFYGWSDTRFVSQGFQNAGLTLGTGGNIGGALGSPIAFGATNYNTAVGTNQTGLAGNFFWGMSSIPNAASGARTNFFGSSTTASGLPDTGQAGFVNNGVPLVIPVMDLLDGSPLTNGTGFTNTTVLGARIKVSDDVDAGLELSAYVSTGDAIVDAFYGTTAPYLSNQFTGSSGISGGQGLNNQPFTRMNLDNFWLIHKPSGLKLQVGSFDGTNFDDIIYVGEYNPNPLGPRYLDNFGLDVRGRTDLFAPVSFELMGTKLADGNLAPTSGSANSSVGLVESEDPFGIFDADGGYQAMAYGGNVDWDLYGKGDFKVDFLRAFDSPANGGPLLVGQITGMDGVWLDWVNPIQTYSVGAPGVTAENTLAGAGTNLTAINGNIGTVGTMDNRPIFSADGTRALDSAGFLGAVENGIPGTFGPQDEEMYGGSLHYTFGEKMPVRVFLEYGNSRYKPSENSNYVANGNAFLGGLGIGIGEHVDLSAEYVTTDPTYDPFILQYPEIDGVQDDYWRTRSFSYFPNAYPLHDTDEFPQNRDGYRIHLKLLAKDDKGEKREFFQGWYYNLNQVQTSLEDQRATVGSQVFANGVIGPNVSVLGFSPGFIEPVFGPESPFSFSNAGTTNGFAQPLDDNRGNETEWGGHFRYRFGSGPWAFGVGYENLQFTRDTNFAPSPFGAAGFAATAAGNMDYTNITSEGGVAQGAYTFNDRFVLKFGISVVNISGHYDPAGVYNNFAFDTQNNTFQNLNTTQDYPFIGFDYDISKNTRMNFNVKFYNTTDNLGSQNFLFLPGEAALPSNIQRDPFSWNGLQLTSEVKVSF